MKEEFSKLKQLSTKNLRILLGSGIVGNEYKSVLSEYMTRPDRANISPCRKFKNQKHGLKIDNRQITKTMVKTLNIRELKSLLASGISGSKRKLVSLEYISRIHQLHDI